MRSFIGSTGAFLPEARALCSHVVLGRLGPEPFEQAYARAAGTLTLDGRTIQVREARPGEPPMFYSYPCGRKVGWVEERSAAGSVVDVAKALGLPEADAREVVDGVADVRLNRPKFTGVT